MRGHEQLTAAPAATMGGTWAVPVQWSVHARPWVVLLLLPLLLLPLLPLPPTPAASSLLLLLPPRLAATCST